MSRLPQNEVKFWGGVLIFFNCEDIDKMFLFIVFQNKKDARQLTFIQFSLKKIIFYPIIKIYKMGGVILHVF